MKPDATMPDSQGARSGADAKLVAALEMPRHLQTRPAVDSHTAHVLRLLAEVVIKIADGDRIELTPLTPPSDSHPPTDRDQPAELLTVDEACRRLRISRWSFYRLLHQQQLTTVTIGRRRFVSPAEIHRFARDLAPGGGST